MLSLKQSLVLPFAPSGLDLYGLLFSCSSLLLADFQPTTQALTRRVVCGYFCQRFQPVAAQPPGLPALQQV